jgi:antitoxin MazE
METTIVKIGNSQGLIIPKKLMIILGENKSVDIQEKDGGLLITPITENKVRSHWEKQFVDAFAKGFTPETDSMDIENDFDKEDWTW